MLEGDDALPGDMLSDGNGDRPTPGPLAPGPAAWPGPVGRRHRPGPERLPDGGRHRLADHRRLACPAPAAARVALQRGREGGPVSDPGRSPGVFRPAVALGAQLV